MTTLSRTKYAIQMALALIVAALALAGCKQELASETGGVGGGEVVADTVWTAEQLDNARLVTNVGHDMGVPRRGIVVALAAAMQESSLRNLEDGDRDSVGLFQQRPSQGWGSWTQCHNARHASQSFYRALLNVPGWDGMSVTAAAQAVQISAYPNAYAKWADDAEKLAG